MNNRLCRHPAFFRPDLTDYRLYVDALVDKLNENGYYKMSRTDAVKIAIEQAAEKVLPGVRLDKKRKKYIKFDL
jgi:hypothetical protein